MPVVLALLDRGADVNALNRRGRSSLGNAAKEGHLDVANALLRAGATARRAHDESPLQLALRHRHEDVAHALLHADAPLDFHVLELAKRASKALRAHVAARQRADRDKRLDRAQVRHERDQRDQQAELHALACQATASEDDRS